MVVSPNLVTSTASNLTQHGNSDVWRLPPDTLDDTATHPDPLATRLARFSLDLTGLAYRQIAQKLGLTHAFLSYWASGQRNLSDVYMAALIGYIAAEDEGLEWGLTDDDPVLYHGAGVCGLSMARFEELTMSSHYTPAKSETKRQMSLRRFELGVLGAIGWDFRNVRYINWWTREIADGTARARQRRRNPYMSLVGDPLHMVSTQPFAAQLQDGVAGQLRAASRLGARGRRRNPFRRPK